MPHPPPGHEPSHAAAAFLAAEKESGDRAADGRPIIKYTEHALPAVVDAAEAALMERPHDVLFQRGPVVVRVVRRQAMSARAFKRPAGGLGIVQVDQAYLHEQLIRAAVWQRWDGRAEEWRNARPPDVVSRTYLARSGHWKLPALLGAISAPTLRPDGSVLQDPGYDPETATWYDPCGIDFPRIPEKPKIKHAQDAADRMLTIVKSIPFVSPSDASVALALMLTSLVRRSLPSAPMGAITAPTPGSGKTLIADCIAILATGVSAPAMQYPASDEEAEKVALSVLMDGAPVVLIDNIERPLQGAWLCSILTSETHQGRMLGRNEMISVPTTTLFLATGNKLVLQGDLRTRALLLRIDPRSENPESREFAVDLREEFMRRRPELVAAGLTLMRAYLLAGERASVFRPWGRFERWSQFCREPLLWLGLNDPCDSYSLIAEEDPERQEHLQMIAAWKEAFASQPKTAAEAIQAAAMDANSTLRDALVAIARDRSGGFSSKKLSGWLRSRDGRIVSGSMFVRRGETRNHVTLWKIEDING